jgi:succinate dehydrogenase/fumarate reductase-like Fe-S protein
MTATLAAQEYCRNQHPRTPENTYVSPAGKRSCRDCSGYSAEAAEIQRGRTSERYTPEQLRRLRELVKCVHCGAVPAEVLDEDGNVVTREVGDSNGGTMTLPYVRTPHAEGCPGETKQGRPKAPEVSAGPCQNCGRPMTTAPRNVTTKKFCGSPCRQANFDRNQRTVTS